MTTRLALDPAIRLLVCTGALGAFTTYSTLAVEIARLATGGAPCSPSCSPSSPSSAASERPSRACGSASSARLSGVFPWGTFAINVSGSFLAGVVTGLLLADTLPAPVATVVAGGFLGAYTTFSTAMYETARLLEDSAPGVALANLLLSLVAAVLAAGLGWTSVTSLG